MEVNKKLNIAFIWHMHQPFYKDTVSEKYLMPWVRLHGVKDYFPMAALIENYENIKVVFNMVPCLVEQINDYVYNDATDILLDLTLKKSSQLTADDKLEILNNFFRVNFKRAIEPNARYAELLVKRGVGKISVTALSNAAKKFSAKDFLDLQVLFNLSWFHSISVGDDINLKDLIEKGSSYTEQDKEYVILKQKEILAQIIPLYKRLQDNHKIEITTTPYYHPILPLLCDTRISKTSSPAMPMPTKRFAHPEDAEWHVREAIKYHTQQFGQAPRGMWPAEGSVSNEALDLLIANGIDWIAADEDILFNSLSLHDRKYKYLGTFDRRLIYQPYKLKRGSKSICIIFRDKNLSDMISFSYNSWDPVQAAEDLLGHFKRISDNLRRDTDRGLATIVMDGENAWEYYKDNGIQFFETLYSNLDRKGLGIETSTISEYLAIEPPKKVLPEVFPGSWINHNFDIWIGEEQDNLSWDYLSKVRQDLNKFTREFHRKSKIEGLDMQKAWRELYIAEGSDWNWWYGGKLGSSNDNPFDKLYRMHLKNVYKLLKKPIPDFLKISIA